MSADPLRGRWTHGIAYDVLRERYDGSDPKHGSYAYLYPQARGENSAVLYAPHSKMRNRPLHLRRAAQGARLDLFAALEAFIEFRYQERVETKPAGFTFYAVTDWDGFARALGLGGRP